MNILSTRVCSEFVNKTYGYSNSKEAIRHRDIMRKDGYQCTYFKSITDDGSVIATYRYEGFHPVEIELARQKIKKQKEKKKTFQDKIKTSYRQLKEIWA